MHASNQTLGKKKKIKCKNMDRDIQELPPTIAHTFVRKCKNEMCSSLKVTYSIKVRSKNQNEPKRIIHVPESHWTIFNSIASASQVYLKTRKIFLVNSHKKKTPP
jgi:hypothetical protein